MIHLRKALIAVTLLLSTMIIIMVLVYLARVAIVKNITEEELTNYQANITCLNFSLTKSLAIAVSRLCLKTPLADIKIEGMVITLALTAEQKIKRIDIASASIKGTAALFDPLSMSSKKNQNTTTSQQLTAYLTQLLQLNLPFELNIAELLYAPFIHETKQIKNNHPPRQTASYLAKLTTTANTIELSLKDVQQTTFLTAELSSKKLKEQQVSVKIAGQLKPLKRFLLSHNLPVEPAILASLATIETSGEFHSTLDYQAGQLTLDSQFKELLIASSLGIDSSGPFKLNGSFNMHSAIALMPVNQTLENDSQLNVTFKQDNTLQLKYSHQHLIDYLGKKALSPALMTLIIDNPIEQLTFSPKGQLTYKLNKQLLSLSSIEIKAKNDLQIPQLRVDNIALDLNYYLSSESMAANINPIESVQFSEKSVTSARLKAAPSMAKLDFKLDSSLLVSAINNVTQSPITFNLQGSIHQNALQTTINFTEKSSFTSNNIAISTKQQTDNKKLVSVKKLVTQIHGEVAIENRIQIKNAENINNKPSINLNLSLISQADKLRADKIIEVKKLMLSTSIAGDLSDIKIQTTVTADNVPLGILAISGPIDKPNITLTATELPLTELLSLNIKLPQKVTLVDGKISYSVKGQVTDLNNIQNTPLAISLAINSLSGEIAGIWIQELNWQQNFNFSLGKLTTYESESLTLPVNSKENLTVALIDIPTPISKLSITTSWHYQKDFKISAKNLKGDILGGSFSIPKIQWPLEHGHSVDVQLSSIDLEQVLALDKKQGIVITGKISGQLPISYDGEKYTMDKGELHNVGNGLIQVIDNPAVQELKASDTQLQLAFDALQNLHYHQLSSDVSMADDGYMLLETVIKGRNPDIDNDVNLNLNLSYDLLGLLESMSITEQFEDRIIKNLQKNKE